MPGKGTVCFQLFLGIDKMFLKLLCPIIRYCGQLIGKSERDSKVVKYHSIEKLTPGEWITVTPCNRT